MIQARTGGTGQRFNLGEMTITRCTVQTSEGYIGHAYIGGKSSRKAELAALFDALAQNPAHTLTIQVEILESLQQTNIEPKKAAAGKKADFIQVKLCQDQPLLIHTWQNGQPRFGE